VLEGALLAFLAIWLGALLMVAATAAIAFPSMRDLDPALPGFASYPTGHWEIAAGHVMAPAFAFSEGVQVVCASVVGVCMAILIATRRLDLSRPLQLFRIVLVVVLVGALIEYLTRIAQPMQSMLVEFWQHAREGRVDEANGVRESFDVLHPKSSMRLSAIMVGLLVAVMASMLSLGANSRGESTP
jgi:hypothetical protein